MLRAFEAGHCPKIHHSDQGVQYAASEYTELLQSQGVRISMADVGEPTQNGYAERFMRTIKEEEVDLSDYEDYHYAYRQIGRFLDDVYMHKRVHSSLKYLTSAELKPGGINLIHLAAFLSCFLGSLQTPIVETVEKVQLKTRKWESVSRKYPVQPYLWDGMFIIDRFFSQSGNFFRHFRFFRQSR